MPIPTEGGIKFTHELPLTTYWTPDGRELHKLANMHGTKQGTVRDANLDNGWLLQPPVEKKPCCPHCDLWHDTQAQVDECGASKRAKQVKYDKEAQEAQAKADELNIVKEDVASLKSDMGEIKDLLTRLLEGKR